MNAFNKFHRVRYLLLPPFVAILQRCSARLNMQARVEAVRPFAGASLARGDVYAAAILRLQFAVDSEAAKTSHFKSRFGNALRPGRDSPILEKSRDRPKVAETRRLDTV